MPKKVASLLAGLEPATSRLTVGRANQLRHRSHEMLVWDLDFLRFNNFTSRKKNENITHTIFKRIIDFFMTLPAMPPFVLFAAVAVVSPTRAAAGAAVAGTAAPPQHSIEIAKGIFMPFVNIGK